MRSTQLSINGKTFIWGTRTYVMGILNITPDSFSGDGLIKSQGTGESGGSFDFISLALEQARRFASAGVDLLDVGGESTRPGSQPISVQEEIDRVVPVIQAVVSELDVPVSIDTYRASVAEAALQAGASMINDVWGFKADQDIAKVAATHEIPVILMHNRSSWAHAEIRERLGGRYVGIPYNNLIEDISNELRESVDLAQAAGIPDERIILDPGIGFGKSVEQNLELIDCLGEIRKLGYPVLLGPSRKSFIGYTLDLPPDQRQEGTAAAIAIGIDRGADMVRVHDVESMMRVVRMTDAIIRRNPTSY